MQFLKSNFSLNRPLAGLRWFVIPVCVNASYISVPSFDGGATSSLILLFSIPYLAVASIIGIRRARHITVMDFLYLAIGNIPVIALLCYLIPLIHSAGR